MSSRLRRIIANNSEVANNIYNSINDGSFNDKEETIMGGAYGDDDDYDDDEGDEGGYYARETEDHIWREKKYGKLGYGQIPYEKKYAKILSKFRRYPNLYRQVNDPPYATPILQRKNIPLTPWQLKLKTDYPRYKAEIEASGRTAADAAKIAMAMCSSEYKQANLYKGKQPPRGQYNVTIPLPAGYDAEAAARARTKNYLTASSQADLVKQRLLDEYHARKGTNIPGNNPNSSADAQMRELDAIIDQTSEADLLKPNVIQAMQKEIDRIAALKEKELAAAAQQQLQVYQGQLNQQAQAQIQNAQQQAQQVVRQSQNEAASNAQLIEQQQRQIITQQQQTQQYEQRLLQTEEQLRQREEQLLQNTQQIVTTHGEQQLTQQQLAFERARLQQEQERINQQKAQVGNAVGQIATAITNMQQVEQEKQRQEALLQQQGQNITVYKQPVNLNPPIIEEIIEERRKIPKSLRLLAPVSGSTFRVMADAGRGRREIANERRNQVRIDRHVGIRQGPDVVDRTMNAIQVRNTNARNIARNQQVALRNMEADRVINNSLEYNAVPVYNQQIVPRNTNTRVILSMDPHGATPGQTFDDDDMLEDIRDDDQD